MKLSDIKQIGIKRTMDVQGRISIPFEFRKSLGMKPGETVEICLYDGFVIVKPCSKQ